MALVLARENGCDWPFSLEIDRTCTLQVPSWLSFVFDGKLDFKEMTFEAKSPLGRLLVERRERVLAIAREHHAANVQVFGSVARGDDTPDSGIDLLVEFLPPLNLLTRVGLVDDLEAELGVSVDVRAPAGLKKRCRNAILAESRVL
jgi:predicted nucleotidyltransferase